MTEFIERLVEIDRELTRLHKKEYALRKSISDIEQTIDETENAVLDSIGTRESNGIKCDPAEMSAFFENHKLLTIEHVIKRHEELIEFYKETSKERNDALKEQLAEDKAELEQINERLQLVNKERDALLAQLNDGT